MTDSNKDAQQRRTPDLQTVLLIDDSEVDRIAMIELLEAAGFVVVALPSPIGATRRAREVGASLAVIDQNLPGMDGTKLAGLFQQNPTLRHVKVVIVSGSDEVAETAKKSGADAFVPKRQLYDLVPVLQRLCMRSNLRG
jgi:CheY-like chemotaxis protein